MAMKTIKDEYKGTQLNSYLRKSLSEMNLARIKLIEMLICALCKARSVNFGKLSLVIVGKAKSDSYLRRIQRFIADYPLNTDSIALLIRKILPHIGQLRLTMDRTNWKFGTANINAPVPGITYKAVAFPILVKMPDKQGNSNTDERIAIIKRFIRLFGQSCIECLLCDREFVGERWVKFLNDLRIVYHIRIRENFYVISPRTGKRIKASWLFGNLRYGEARYHSEIFSVNNQLCYLSATLAKNSKELPELQIIISYNKPEQAQELYKERRQIETAFRGIKSSGFNIEGTHLTQIDRLEKFFAIVMLAFAWAYVVGDYLDRYYRTYQNQKTRKKSKKYFQTRTGLYH